ncbi:unnamed protein product, partial [Nesidiocoris tenuis]
MEVKIEIFSPGEISPKSGLSVTILELTPTSDGGGDSNAPGGDRPRRDSNGSDAYAPNNEYI